MSIDPSKWFLGSLEVFGILIPGSIAVFVAHEAKTFLTREPHESQWFVKSENRKPLTANAFQKVARGYSREANKVFNSIASIQFRVTQEQLDQMRALCDNPFETDTNGRNTE